MRRKGIGKEAIKDKRKRKGKEKKNQMKKETDVTTNQI